MGIVEREDDDVTMEKLDKALGELFEKKVPGDGWDSFFCVDASTPECSLYFVISVLFLFAYHVLGIFVF